MKLLALTITLLAAALHAEQPSRFTVVDPIRDVVFPQIADGAGWNTTIVLVNMADRPSTYELTFGDPEGRNLFLDFVGIGRFSIITGTIPLNGSVHIETAGISPTLKQGAAVLTTGGTAGTVGAVSGYAIFRQRVPGRPDLEASVPASPLNERRMRLAFNNAGGYATGVALVNGTSSAVDVVVIAYYTDGSQAGVRTLSMPRFGQRAFVVADEFPELRGRVGVIELTSPGLFLSGLALWFNPTGAFTSVSPLSLDLWNR